MGKQHGYSDHEIAKALADPSVQQAIQTASLQNPYAGVAASAYAGESQQWAGAAGCAPCQAIAACSQAAHPSRWCNLPAELFPMQLRSLLRAAAAECHCTTPVVYMHCKDAVLAS